MDRMDRMDLTLATTENSREVQATIVGSEAMTVSRSALLNHARLVLMDV